MLATTSKEGPAFQEDLSTSIICPECREVPPNLIEEFSSGDTVCASCGIVVGSRIIDTRSEWRTFANDDQNGDDPSRVGAAQDEFSEGQHLSTTVAFSESKAHKNLSRINNNASQDKTHTGLMQAYKDIVALGEKMHAGSNIINSAKHIYRLIHKEQGLRNKNYDAIIGTCILIACRQNEVGRSFKEIFALTGVDKRTLGRVFKPIQALLKEKSEEPSQGGGQLGKVDKFVNGSTSAAELCGRYVSNLGFQSGPEIARLSTELAKKAISNPDLAGRSPLSVAAACIYLVCHLVGEPKPCGYIAKQAGVSEGTVKTAYKFLFASRETLIEKRWLNNKVRLENIPQVQTGL